ncbi:hypothetical protein HMI55_001356 [Coelomomyces lativittatus]|nr:hypothetical protein HMI55_001356 [Coelomomyces lativittatus]
MCGLKNGLSQPYGWAVNVEYDIPNSNIPLYPSSTVSEAIRATQIICSKIPSKRCFYELRKLFSAERCHGRERCTVQDVYIFE